MMEILRFSGNGVGSTTTTVMMMMVASVPAMVTTKAIETSTEQR